MDSRVKDLLYDHPEYYEALYPEAHVETPTCAGVSSTVS